MNTDKLIVALRQVIDAHKDRDQPGLLTHDLITVFKHHCPEQTGTNPHVVRSLPDFKFTEWLGETYIRLNQVWVHRYSSQLHKENWKTTEELYELYLKQQGQ